MPERRHAYEPVLSSNAAAFLVEQPKRIQRALIGIMEKLAEQPSQLGDYGTKDSSERTLQVLKTGRFTLIYWADDPVKEPRIVEISIL